ncbi:glycosyltransferase family protein [Chryseobacterium lacus]|uniref:hypothetical protein n=1 Tax=Chryseobacterium lacus TaxID=2058346 RepID=UPI000F87F692|nr:hypothetical protein [Chryseobacterium lacus]RST26690.1 hypothetical protein EIZ46_05385 [Chryseobacterium lacus]
MMVTDYNYTFFYPSKAVGGAQILFSRIAEMLIHEGNRVTILGPSSSYINLYLSERGLHYDSYEVSTTSPYHTNEDSFFILSLSYILLFHKYIKPDSNVKLFFWDLHPYAVLENLSFSKFYKLTDRNIWINVLKLIERSFIVKMSTLLERGHQKGGIHFMCYRNFKINKDFFSLDFEPSYIPLPIEVAPIATAFKSNFRDICWMSRLDNDKTPILQLLMEDVIEYNNHYNEKLRLHIIGDGNDRVSIETIAKKYDSIFILVGTIKNDCLLSFFVKENILLGFGMGTSSLEFASRGIASVLVPSSTESIFYKNKVRRYMYLKDVKGYDVAVEKFHYEEGILLAFPNIIDTFSSNKMNESLHYVSSAHHKDKVFHLLRNKINNNTLTFGDIYSTGVLKINFFQKLKEIVKKINGKKYG